MVDIYLIYFAEMGKTWQSFAQKMMDFNFECIGEKLTDDEEKIGTLKQILDKTHWKFKHECLVRSLLKQLF